MKNAIDYIENLISAVEENDHRTGGSCWACWDDANHIIEIYGEHGKNEYDLDTEEIGMIENILNSAIKTDGESLQIDLGQFKEQFYY